MKFNIDEYQISRNNVALLDFSDMVNIKISGENALPFLDKICTGEINSLAEGQSLNTMMCDDNGLIVAIVWVLKDDEFFYVHSDTEKKEKLNNWINICLENYKDGEVDIEDIESTKACLSLIGPKAIEIPKILIDEDIIGLQYLGFEHNSIEDVECIVCRYGYTGEYEYRIIFDLDHKEEMINKILETGQEYGIQACSKDILNVLYLEMKSINQNTDISEDTLPLEAGLHWMINFRKDDFIAKNVLEEVKQKSAYNKFVMLTTTSDVVLKEAGKVTLSDKEDIGDIVHFEYSPKLEKTIALASIQNHYAWSGLDILIEPESGDMLPAETVSAPLFITQTVIAAREE